MDFYNRHNVTVRTYDQDKADAIMMKYKDKEYFDEYLGSYAERNDDGSVTITYRVAPYISEELEEIKNEFRDNGIQVM